MNAVVAVALMAAVLAAPPARASALSVLASTSPSLAGAGASLATGDPAPPWWQAFDDPLLNSLIARSSGTQAIRLTLVCNYIEVRVAQARLVLAQRLLAAAAEQRGMLQRYAAPSDARDRWLATASARLEQGLQLRQSMAAERDAALARLAALSRVDAPQLLQALDDPDSGPAIPEVQRDLPAPQPARFSRMSALLASSQRASQARQLLQASALDLQSQQLRTQAAGESPMAVLEAYQRWVADADRMTALAGQAAIAWAEWLQRGAGER